MAAHPAKWRAKIFIAGGPFGLLDSCVHGLPPFGLLDGDRHGLAALTLRLLRYSRAGIIGRNNSHRDEFRMRVRPRESLPFGFKEPIHYNGISFGSGAARAAGRSAIFEGKAGIDRGEDAVREDDFAAIRNPARIDRAMSNPQADASGGLVFPCIAIRTASAASPINRDSRQE